MNRQALYSGLTALMVGLSPLGAEELTLARAMALARDQAQEVLTARARAEAGASRLRQTKGSRLPQVSLQEIWITTENPAETFALQLNQERFSFQDFVLSDPNDPDWFDNATTRLEMTVPLYTGGELSGRIGQAANAKESAAADEVWAGHGAALAAAEAYIRLSQARENAQLLEQIMETVRAHAALARAYVDQGMLVRSELLRAEVERSRIEDLLHEARGQARVAAANLSFRLGAPQQESWELDPLPEPWPLEEELQAWLSTADSRADLDAARRMLRAAELEIRVKRSALLPRVGLAARYDLYDDTLFGSHGKSGAILAMASVDLFSGNRHRAAKAAAEADFEAGKQQIAQFTEGVRLEVRDAYERAVAARKRHRTATAAQEAAIEAERIVEERFRQGVVKMIDLLDATTSLQEARTRELVARAEAHLTALTLAVRSGRRPEVVLSTGVPVQTRSQS